MSPKLVKIIFPAIYGLVIYACIRLVNDVISGEQFWTRDWKTNAIEISCCILFSYLFKILVDYFIRRSLEKNNEGFNRSMVAKEFLRLTATLELLVILTLFPLAEFTDNGLQWFDAINLSLIPVLFWLLYFSFVLGMRMMQKAHEQQLKIEKITSDKLNTELRFLKAQFHPHFLFNALNTVYFQIDNTNTMAKFTIEKLSELLRYQLYDQTEMVPLKRELDYLETYIALQRQRMEEDLNLNFNIPSGIADERIYPLLLLPLVENAFKFVGGTGIIRISTAFVNHQLRFEVYNSIPNLIDVEQNKGGIGLDNLRRRLDLLYPNKHQLMVENNHNYFQVELNIFL